MKYSYYLFIFAPILWEFITITNIVRVHRFAINLKALKGKKFDDYTTNQKAVSVFMMVYFFWCFIGLFSSQWFLFLVLLFLSFIPKKYIVLRFIDSVLSFALLIFILLNAFHFNINVFELFKIYLCN